MYNYTLATDDYLPVLSVVVIAKEQNLCFLNISSKG